jgi:hypothetical protein
MMKNTHTSLEINPSMNDTGNDSSGLNLDQLTLFQSVNNEKVVTAAEHYAKHILIIYTGKEYYSFY